MCLCIYMCFLALFLLFVFFVLFWYILILSLLYYMAVYVNLEVGRTWEVLGKGKS